MRKREFWVNGGVRVEVYRSSYSSGITCRRRSIARYRGTHLGVNDFNTIARCREFLGSKGFKREIV